MDIIKVRKVDQGRKMGNQHLKIISYADDVMGARALTNHLRKRRGPKS